MSDRSKVSGREVPKSLFDKLTNAITSSEDYEGAIIACEEILKPFRREPYYGGARSEAKVLLGLYWPKRANETSATR